MGLKGVEGWRWVLLSRPIVTSTRKARRKLHTQKTAVLSSNSKGRGYLYSWIGIMCKFVISGDNDKSDSGSLALVGYTSGQN